MLRVVFMGTPEFAVPSLESVHKRHTIVGVFTQSDKPVGRGLDVRFCPVKAKALQLGLNVFQPEKASAPAEFERLKELNPDIIVVVAYGQILKKNVLELPRLGCVNVHSSLLPRWRGAAPIQWAILQGDSLSGVTTQRLVEKLDAGPILLQETTPLSADETASSLHDRLAQIGANLLARTLEGLASDTLKEVIQDESKVTYASKLTKEMEWLNPAEAAATLERRVRALNPWPGTSLKLGQRLKVKQARARDVRGVQGQVFHRAGMILLGTSEGSLDLQRVQWDGKREIGPEEFMNGLKGKGQSLPLEVKSIR